MLTNKQRVFVAEYVRNFNATRAAIAAGYSEKAAHAIGWENLRKPEISEEIERVIADRYMTKNEVLTRLAEHARGDMGDFVTIHNGTLAFDFSTAPEQGKMRLVKKLRTKTKSYVIKGDDTPVTEVDIEFELYDAQSALVHLGRHHKLFTDRQEIAGDKDDPFVIETRVVDYRSGLALVDDENV